MSSETLIDSFIEAVLATLAPTAGVAGRVSEDRQRAFTKEEAPAIDIRIVEASSETLGDDHPARSTLQVRVLLDLGIYTRGQVDQYGSETVTPRAAAAPIWLSAHRLLMADPSLGGLAVRLRWRGCTWRRESADGVAGWADHRYEATLAMREQTLQARQP